MVEQSTQELEICLIIIIYQYGRKKFDARITWLGVVIYRM